MPMTLSDKIRIAFPQLSDVDFALGRIVVRNDGAGDYLAEWNLNDLARPTQEFLDAITSRPVRAEDVDVERDRRMALMTFQGYVFDADPVSLRRIETAKTNALAATITGADSGDLRWAHPDMDFSWFDHSNQPVPMDAQTCLAFGLAAAAWEGLHIVAARVIKNMMPIPSDYANNSYWPQD